MCCRIVTAGHVHFDVAETALRQMGLEGGKRVGRFHVGHQSHVDLRDGAMRQDRFATGAGITADQALQCLLSAAIRSRSFACSHGRSLIQCCTVNCFFA